MKSIYKEDLFQGKTALITGGGTGIGLRTARELSMLGATVILASRKRDKLDAGLATLKKNCIEALALECNIRDEESVQKCVQDAMEKTGTIDFLINNAGGQFPSPGEAISRKGWNAVIETNLTGTFFMSQALFHRVFKEKGGAIVNVIANMFSGFPMMSHTGAARAGVDNLTKSLATEWGRYGIRINSVAPGTIDSSGLDSYGPDFRPFVMAAGKNNQTYRLGSEEEISAAILFLLSPAAVYITGETLRVDGGESLYHPLYPPTEHDKLPPFKD